MDLQRGPDIDLSDLDSSGGDGAATPPGGPERRRGGGSPVRFGRFAPIFLIIALIVGIERVSMLMFVMRDPPPEALILGGSAFIVCVMTVFCVGAWQFGKHRRG